MSDENEKKDKKPELVPFEQRELAASGMPAPTMAEALHELKIIQQILEKHGCATTRDLVAGAAVVVDVAHQDAHTKSYEDVNKFAVEMLDKYLIPFRTEVLKRIAEETEPAKRAKSYARLTALIFYFARLTGVHAILETREAEQQQKQAQPAQISIPAPPSGQELTEDEKTKLLDMLTTSKYTN